MYACLGSPWYDFMSVSVQLERQKTAKNYAAKALCFVEITRKGTDEREGEGMYVFVEFYVSALTDNEKKPEDLRGRRAMANDLSVGHRINNLPCVHPDPDYTRRDDLVDVSAIQHGLWVEKDAVSEKFWVVSYES